MPKGKLDLRIGLLAFVFLLGGCALMRQQPAPLTAANLLDIAQGRWDWEGAKDFCVDSPHTISFSPDKSRMIFTYPREFKQLDGTMANGYQYEIRNVTGNTIRAFLIGENRRLKNNELVVWDMVILDQNSYCWRNDDMSANGCTRKILRCEPVSR